MELRQEIRLSADEIKQAIRRYVASKNTGSAPRDYDVALHLRGKHGAYATVTVLKPVPVLTERIEDL